MEQVIYEVDNISWNISSLRKRTDSNKILTSNQHCSLQLDGVTYVLNGFLHDNFPHHFLLGGSRLSPCFFRVLM